MKMLWTGSLTILLIAGGLLIAAAQGQAPSFVDPASSAGNVLRLVLFASSTIWVALELGYGPFRGLEHEPDCPMAALERSSM